MAGSALTSKTIQSGNQPWTTKAMNTIGQVGHGIAIAQGIREAAPHFFGILFIIMGCAPLGGSWAHWWAGVLSP